MLTRKQIHLMLLTFILSFAFLLSSCGGKTPASSKGSSSGTKSSVSSGGSADSDNSDDTQSEAQSLQSANSSKKSEATASSASAKSTASYQKVDMKGYEFTYASSWMTAESSIGENTPLFERYFYDRAKEVAKDLNCKIKILKFTANSSNLRTAIMAGKKVADVVETMPTWIPQSSSAGYLRDWNSVEGINIKDSKWLSYASEISTHNGKVYGLSFLKPPEARYCIMFNKSLLEKNGVKAASLYNLVRNKAWTWEELRNAAVKVTDAPNSYGLAGKYEYIANGMLSSFGGSLVSKSGSRYTYNLNSSASLAAMNYYNQLVNTDKVVWIQDAQLSPASYGTVAEQSYVQAFNSGKIAFLLWESWVLNQYTKANASFDFGILPLPMGGSAKEYVSPAQNMRVMSLTTTNKDLDKTVTVLNRLAEPVEGYDNENAWWEDIQADYFQSKDKDSLEMYKMILNSSMRDAGLSVETLEASFYKDLVMEAIYWKNKAVGTAVEGINGVFDDAINSILNK